MSLDHKSSEELRERFFKIHNEQLDLGKNEKVSDSQILMCFNGNGNRMQTASTIANFLDISESTARKRMKKLEDNYILYKERVGRRHVWTMKHWFATPFSAQILRYLEDKVEEQQ